MSKLRKEVDTRQLSIFEAVKELAERQKRLDPFPGKTGKGPGSLNIDAAIREMISEALKNSKMDRYGVASEMSRLLGREVTKARLDSWSAESKEGHKFPLANLPSFAEATGAKAILRFLCELAGGRFIEGEDVLRLELERIGELEREIKVKKRRIREALGES